MKNRSAEEILSFTFAHLDTALREKRYEHEEAHDKTGGKSAKRSGQEDPAVPNGVAGEYIRAE